MSDGLERPRKHREFYPLAVGNRWYYGKAETGQVIEIGHPPPPPPEIQRSVIEAEIIGIERRFGRDYFVERAREYDEYAGRLNVLWTRFRQDDTGLYTADVSPRLPPRLGGGAQEPLLPGGRPENDLSNLSLNAPLRSGSAPSDMPVISRGASLPRLPDIKQAKSLIAAARCEIERAAHLLPDVWANESPAEPLPGESTRIVYPLIPGEQWFTGASFATVEGYEEVDVLMGTSPAVRVRIDLLVPFVTDSVAVWYGHCGRLRTFSRFDAIAIDPETGRLVRIISEVDESLGGHAFVTPHACPIRPPWQRRGPTTDDATAPRSPSLPRPADFSTYFRNR